MRSEEYGDWRKHNLRRQEYVYIWADGIYFNIRGDESRQCILVIIGVTAQGNKEFLAITDGYRESEQSGSEVLLELKNRGMNQPKLAIGDGALGFWKALQTVFGKTRHQRCWVHYANFRIMPISPLVPASRIIVPFMKSA